MAAKYVLGINTLQLNHEVDYAGHTKNQLQVFARLGLFTGELPEQPDRLPSLDDYRDTSCDVAKRARSYLHANCSHCHRKWGGGNGEFRLLATLKGNEMDILDQRPRHGGFYIPDARMVAPGDPSRSVLFYRMAKLGPGRMPRLGSSMVDHDGLNLIHGWILGLKPSASKREERRVVAALNALTSAEARAARIDKMLETTTGAIELMRAADSELLDTTIRTEVIERSTGSPAAHIRDLFERFLPEELRPKRLGNVIRPDDILSLSGDEERGEALFSESSRRPMPQLPQNRWSGNRSRTGPEFGWNEV